MLSFKLEIEAVFPNSPEQAKIESGCRKANKTAKLLEIFGIKQNLLSATVPDESAF